MERNTLKISIEAVVFASFYFFVLSQYFKKYHLSGRKKFTVQQNKLTFKKLFFLL